MQFGTWPHIFYAPPYVYSILRLFRYLKISLLRRTGSQATSRFAIVLPEMGHQLLKNCDTLTAYAQGIHIVFVG